MIPVEPGRQNSKSCLCVQTTAQTEIQIFCALIFPLQKHGPVYRMFAVIIESVIATEECVWD